MRLGNRTGLKRRNQAGHGKGSYSLTSWVNNMEISQEISKCETKRKDRLIQGHERLIVKKLPKSLDLEVYRCNIVLIQNRCM